jgi:hypothetical protein
MIVPYKNKNHKQGVEKSVRGYMEKQEIVEERKRWQRLPQEEQGKYKLARLYKKQDNPKFVARYLKHQNVSIFLISPNDNENMFGIDPYAKKFYKNPDEQIFTADPEIVKIGYLITENIKKLYPRSYVGATDSCINSVLFGKDEDVMHEFVKVNESLQYNIQGRHLNNLGSIIVAIKYPCVKNNALEFLLQQEKQLNALLMDKQSRCNIGYTLLKEAAQNKKDFELIAHKDPYNSNRMLYFSTFKKMTHLDRMKNEDSNTFDQEHIDIFVREGGMSATEVEGMKQVGRVLRGKITDEELLIRNVLNTVINNSNSDNSNKYLESRILLRDVQEREEAARRLNQRAMMMAGLMHAMFGDFDVD